MGHLAKGVFVECPYFPKFFIVSTHQRVSLSHFLYVECFVHVLYLSGPLPSANRNALGKHADTWETLVF